MKIGRFFETDISIDYSWLIFFLLVTFTQKVNNVVDPIWNAITYILLFGIVLLHEFGHIFAARWCGNKAEKITLMAFGGLADCGKVKSAKHLFYTIICGPLVNIILIPITYYLCLWVGDGIEGEIGRAHV